MYDNKLTKQFCNDEDFNVQSKRFYKALKRKLHKCFTKIRIKNKNGIHLDREIRELIDEKNELVQDFKRNKETPTKSSYDKINLIEEKIKCKASEKASER